METRNIEVLLSPEAAKLYDATVNGGDDRTDVLLAVEKAIVKTLYPDRVTTGGLSGEQVDLDPDLVDVRPGLEV